MTDQVLILGGCGRIGSSVAQDIANHTQAQITVTSRTKAGIAASDRIGSQVQFLAMDLADAEKLTNAMFYNTNQAEQRCTTLPCKEAS